VRILSKHLSVVLGLGLAAHAQILPSWQNAATGDAGRALQGSVASVTGNPAAIEQPRRPIIEFGVGDFATKGHTPWATAIAPVGQEAMLGMSLGEPNLGALDNHRVEISGVTRIFNGSWIGLQSIVQKQPQGTQLDFGLGGYHRVNAQLRLGWNAQNLTEALDSVDCPTCSNRRFGVGAAWFFDAQERFGLFTDAEFRSLQIHDYALIEPTFGLHLSVGKSTSRELQLLASTRISHLDSTAQIHFSGGVVFQQAFLGTLVSIRYAMTALTIKGDQASPSHQLSLGMIWDAFADRESPKPFIRTTHATISPAGTGDAPRTLDFLIRVEDDSDKLGDWSLVLYSTNKELLPGELMRRFQGQGMPPRSIAWSGDDITGSVCANGVYAYRLLVRDPAGNQAWTEWQYVEIQ